MKTRLQRIGDAILFGAVCGGSVALLICVITALISAGVLPSGLPASDVSDAFTGGLYSLAGSAVFIILGAALGRKWEKR